MPDQLDYKQLRGVPQLTILSDTPTTRPPIGQLFFYSKSGKGFYRMDSDGAEKQFDNETVQAVTYMDDKFNQIIKALLAKLEENFISIDYDELIQETF